MAVDERDTREFLPLGGPICGSVKVPGDKSISHRAVLFSAMAQGVSQLSGVLRSADVEASIEAVKALGADVNLQVCEDDSLAGTIEGWGEAGPKQPDDPIDCRNSGTTARLLMGVLAPWEIEVEITGDASLRGRPMRRNTAPLMKMGVHFEPPDADHLPIKIRGNRKLRAIRYDAPMASAQLKTAVLLAGVYAKGKTVLREPAPSRNHTELMLPEFGVPTTAGTCIASVEGPTQLVASEVAVPGDASSASFLCAAAILNPGSDITVENVSLNPARTGFIRTLERMGANIEAKREGFEGKEPFGSIRAAYTEKLVGCEVPSQHFASILDEVPVLAFVAAHAKGMTVFRGVSELRAKESDRLAATIEGIGILGASAWEEGENLFVEGNPGLTTPAGTLFDSHGDHRLAIVWALAGLCGKNPVRVTRFGCVQVSYPNFLRDIENLEGRN